jgi:hypothetical protein
VDGLDDRRGGDAGVVHGGGGGDDGYDLGGIRGRGRCGGESIDVEGKELLDGDVLGGEDAVEALEGEGSLAVEEVGDVGLAE